MAFSPHHEGSHDSTINTAYIFRVTQLTMNWPLQCQTKSFKDSRHIFFRSLDMTGESLVLSRAFQP
jgi:hypothetical protein